jgi:hypothetical protein
MGDMPMSFEQYLTEKRSSIVKKWYDAVKETLPIVPSGASEEQRGGATFSPRDNLALGLEGLFDALLQGVMPDDISRFLNSMMRLRASQDVIPSQAMAFIVQVKKAVRQELGGVILSDLRLGEELTAWESVVDDLVLFAFDTYVRYREEILEFKAQEAKNETLKLLKKAKLISDDQESL